MKIDCPSPADEGFRSLVDKYGKEKAYVAYFRNGHEIPNLRKAEGDLSFRPTEYKGPADKRSAVEQYAGIPQSQGGRYISTDISRKIVPNFDRTNPTATHSAASAIADEAFDAGLKDPAVTSVEFTAGGSGSGKSSSMAKLAGKVPIAGRLTYDGLFSGATSLKRLAEAVDSGKPVILNYVYRPMESAIHGVFARRKIRDADRNVAVVPHDVVANGHFNAPRNILKAAEKYKDNPNVTIRVIDNSGPEGESHVVEDPVAFVKQVVAGHPSIDEYTRQAREHPGVATLTDTERATYHSTGRGQGRSGDVRVYQGVGQGGTQGPGQAPLDLVDTEAARAQAAANATRALSEQGRGESEHPGGGRSGQAAKSGGGNRPVDTTPGASPSQPPSHGTAVPLLPEQITNERPADTQTPPEARSSENRPEAAGGSGVDIRQPGAPGPEHGPSDSQLPAGTHGEAARVLRREPASEAQSLSASERADLRSGAVGAEGGNPPTSQVAGRPTLEVPLGEITLSRDVPQFKANANEEGVVEPLGGKFDRRGVGPVAIWERLNGSKELISGRHRFKLAKDTGETTIPAQIFKESEGFDKNSAATLDAELNIRDGNGTIADYSNFFRGKQLSEQDAVGRGLLARTKGKTGYQIARDASEDTFSLHQADRISDDAASSISRAAPGDAGLQSVGVRSVLEGKSAAFAENLVQAARLRSGGSSGAESGDLFAFDDSAMREMEAQAKRAQQAQQAIREQISAVQGAARNPAVAKRLGVDVKDPATVQARIAKLKEDLERWQHWPTQEDLVAKTRDPAFDPRSDTAALPGLIAGRGAERWADAVINQSALGIKAMNVTNLPEYYAALAIKGAAIVERGIRDFATWSAEMAKEFAGLTSEQLEKVWAQVKANGAEIPDSEKPRPTGEPGKSFRSLPDTEREGQRAAGVDPLVERQSYDIRSRDAARKAARVMIDIGGAEKAREMARDPESQLPQDVRGGIYVELALDADKRILDAKTPEERAAAIRDRQALSSSEAPELTSLGQRISMMAELNKNTRAGVTQEYFDETDRRQQQEFGTDGKKAADDFAKANNDINAGAVGTAVEGARPAIAKVKLSEPIWEKYRQDAANRLADLVESKVQPPKEKAPLQEFTQRIIDEIKGRMKELLPEKETAVPPSPLAVLSEAMRNPERYRQVVDSVRKEFVDRFGEGSPPVDMIDSELGNMDLKPYSSRILDRVIREAHQAMQTSVADIARKHWVNADRVNRDLAEALVAGMRLNPRDAHLLADDLQERMNKLTADAKQRAVDQLINRAQTTRARQVLTNLGRLVNLNNLGALTEATARDAVAKSLGLPHVKPEALDRLGYLADKVETAPNMAARAKATIELAKAIRDEQRPGAWRDAIDTGFSLLYANLLASKTIGVKGFADVFNTLSRVGSAIIVNPLEAGTVVRGWMGGLGMGLRTAKSVFERGKGGIGYSPELGGYRAGAEDPWILSGLEGKPLPHKYVARIYKGIESAFYYPAREAYARLVATKILKTYGIRGIELRRRVRNDLGTSPDLFEKFRRQAESEGFKNDDVGLRVGSLIEQHRLQSAPEAAAAGSKFGEEVVFKQQPRGIEGVIYRSGRDLASKVTIAGIPVLKPFMLFMKIPTNAFSMSAEYTPVGIKRAFWGPRDASGEPVRPSPDERNQLLLRGTAGSLLMGALTAAVVNKLNNGYFDVTGRGPADPAKRKQLQQSGWIPYSFQVQGGPRLSFAHSPMMIPLAFVGNVADSYRYEKETPQSNYFLGSRLAHAAMRSSFSVIDLPMLQGMSQMIDGIRGRESAESFNRFLAGTAANVVLPKGLMDIDQMLNPTEYNTMPGMIGELASQTPFVRRLGSERIGPTGEPMTYNPIQRFISTVTPGIAKELSERGVFITNEPRPQLGTGSSRRPSTQAEYEKYQREAGVEILEQLRAAMPEIRGMSHQEAQERVNKIVRDARYNARINLESLQMATP